jgi:aspartate aminotransferase
MTVRQDPGPVLVRSSVDFSGQQFLMFVLDEMAYEYEQRHDDVIRLTLGKSELPLHPAITEAMVAALTDHRRSTLVFPAGLPELRRRLAEFESGRHGVDVPAERVVVSVGTSTLYRNILALVAGPGDEVLLPRPYYPLYLFSALLAGAAVLHYEVDPESMRIDVDSLRARVGPRTRAVVVNSPGNPLGNVAAAEELRAVDLAVDGRALLISDEIYGNVCFDEAAPSLLDLGPLRSPSVVTNAFSKGYRMYARRVGYAIVPEELVQPLTVIQHHTLLTTDPVPQFGAMAALDLPQELDDLTALYRSRRDYTLERLASAGGVRAIPSRGGFYLTLDCAGHMLTHGMETSLELAQAIMRETHVATVPGSDFGLPLTLRLSFSAERYEEAIDRLAAYFGRGAE